MNTAAPAAPVKRAAPRTLKQWARDAKADFLKPVHALQAEYVDNVNCPLEVRKIMGELINKALPANEAGQKLSNIENGLPA